MCECMYNGLLRIGRFKQGAGQEQPDHVHMLFMCIITQPNSLPQDWCSCVGPSVWSFHHGKLPPMLYCIPLSDPGSILINNMDIQQSWVGVLWECCGCVIGVCVQSCHLIHLHPQTGKGTRVFGRTDSKIGWGLLHWCPVWGYSDVWQ